MRAQTNPYEDLLEEDGSIPSSPAHPYRDLFKRNDLKFKDVGYHTRVDVSALSRFLNGYGKLTTEQLERVKQLADVVEHGEIMRRKKKSKSRKRRK